MPESGVDSGGKNWNSIYSIIDKNVIPKLNVKVENFGPGGNKQTDGYEKIGDWIHTINASEWISAPHKNEIIANLLDQYL